MISFNGNNILNLLAGLKESVSSSKTDSASGKNFMSLFAGAVDQGDKLSPEQNLVAALQNVLIEPDGQESKKVSAGILKNYLKSLLGEEVKTDNTSEQNPKYQLKVISNNVEIQQNITDIKELKAFVAQLMKDIPSKGNLSLPESTLPEINSKNVKSENLRTNQNVTPEAVSKGNPVIVSDNVNNLLEIWSDTPNLDNKITISLADSDEQVTIEILDTSGIKNSSIFSNTLSVSGNNISLATFSDSKHAVLEQKINLSNYKKKTPSASDKVVNTAKTNTVVKNTTVTQDVIQQTVNNIPVASDKSNNKIQVNSPESGKESIPVHTDKVNNQTTPAGDNKSLDPEKVSFKSSVKSEAENKKVVTILKQDIKPEVKPENAIAQEQKTEVKNNAIVSGSSNLSEKSETVYFNSQSNRPAETTMSVSDYKNIPDNANSTQTKVTTINPDGTVSNTNAEPEKTTSVNGKLTSEQNAGQVNSAEVVKGETKVTTINPDGTVSHTNAEPGKTTSVNGKLTSEQNVGQVNTVQVVTDKKTPKTETLKNETVVVSKNVTSEVNTVVSSEIVSEPSTKPVISDKPEGTVKAATVVQTQPANTSDNINPAKQEMITGQNNTVENKANDIPVATKTNVVSSSSANVQNERIVASDQSEIKVVPSGKNIQTENTIERKDVPQLNNSKENKPAVTQGGEIKSGSVQISAQNNQEVVQKTTTVDSTIVSHSDKPELKTSDKPVTSRPGNVATPDQYTVKYSASRSDEVKAAKIVGNNTQDSAENRPVATTTGSDEVKQSYNAEKNKISKNTQTAAKQNSDSFTFGNLTDKISHFKSSIIKNTAIEKIKTESGQKGNVTEKPQSILARKLQSGKLAKNSLVKDNPLEAPVSKNDLKISIKFEKQENVSAQQQVNKIVLQNNGKKIEVNSNDLVNNTKNINVISKSEVKPEKVNTEKVLSQLSTLEKLNKISGLNKPVARTGRNINKPGLNEIVSFKAKTIAPEKVIVTSSKLIQAAQVAENKNPVIKELASKLADLKDVKTIEIKPAIKAVNPENPKSVPQVSNTPTNLVNTKNSAELVKQKEPALKDTVTKTTNPVNNTNNNLGSKSATESSRPGLVQYENSKPQQQSSIDKGFVAPKAEMFTNSKDSGPKITADYSNEVKLDKPQTVVEKTVVQDNPKAKPEVIRSNSDVGKTTILKPELKAPEVVNISEEETVKQEGNVKQENVTIKERFSRPVNINSSPNKVPKAENSHNLVKQDDPKTVQTEQKVAEVNQSGEKTAKTIGVTRTELKILSDNVQDRQVKRELTEILKTSEAEKFEIKEAEKISLKPVSDEVPDNKKTNIREATQQTQVREVRASNNNESQNYSEKESESNNQTQQENKEAASTGVNSFDRAVEREMAGSKDPFAPKDPNAVEQNQEFGKKADNTGAIGERDPAQVNNIQKTVELAQAKPERFIERARVVQEIEKFIETRRKEELIIQVTPENLGKVKIALKVSNESLTANIEVESESVKKLIESSMDNLKQNLSNNGQMSANVQVALANSQNKQQNKFAEARKRTQKDSGPDIDNIKQENSEETKNLGYNTYEFTV